ncbi:CDP-alcohol phosphatidyltransferase family protein [Candidatus Peregrinibacteria bacterium]|nr:CDP-alcohol phosphatidyltransferase family protein [Candidatus Peregrinibacteria bacterium]
MRAFQKSLKEFGETIKIKKDEFARPIFKFLVFIKVSPLTLSFLALFLGLAGAFYLTISRGVFLILVALGWIFDLFDGGLARYKNDCSGQGFWFDYILDRIVVLSVMVAVFFISGRDNILYIFVPLLYCVVHLIYAFNRGKLVLIYVHPIYFLLTYFNIFYASVFFLTVNIINLCLFVFFKKIA